MALPEDPEAQGHAGRAAARLGRSPERRWRAVAGPECREPGPQTTRPQHGRSPADFPLGFPPPCEPGSDRPTTPQCAGRRATRQLRPAFQRPRLFSEPADGHQGPARGLVPQGIAPPLGSPSLGSPLPAPEGGVSRAVRPPPPLPLPESHSLRIRRQIGEGKHWGGEVLGTTVEGAGGGPSQDGWLGSVTFQWPDMSEQEDTTAPPGRRHSSFWSLVQVPGAGRWESGVWGQQSHSPPVGQCARPVLRRLTEGPGAVCGEDGRPWAWGWAPGLSLVQQERGHAAASPPRSTQRPLPRPRPRRASHAAWSH